MKEDIAKLYKADLEYNAANPLFSDKDDEMLGERKQGYYSKIDDQNGRKFLCHTFDNGHCYFMNPNTRKLMQFMELRPDIFLHKFIETYLSNFIAGNPSEVFDQVAVNTQFEEVNVSRGEVLVAKFELDRDENSLLLSLPAFNQPDLGLKLVEGIYRLCKYCAFQMFVGDAAPAVNEALEKAGAVSVEDEENMYEITDECKFS
ncbi:MAG: hypothetical protein K6G31_09120 [Paludibacteraceae bacterium]|nr:hypothetical protein [Paludibacteraceae bacterium]